MKYGKSAYYWDLFFLKLRTTVYKVYAARTLFLIGCALVLGVLFIDPNSPGIINHDLYTNATHHSRLLLYSSTMLLLTMVALISNK